MPIWTNNPDAAAAKTNYRIMRAPANRPLHGVILDEDFTGTHLHFWKGRSTPCESGDCEACASGHRPRWKGYIHLYAPSTKTIVIFEFTERVVHEFRDFVAKMGSLRGAVITVKRLNGKPNGPLYVEFAEGRQDGALLPTAAPIEDTLCRIWEIRQETFDFGDQRDERPTLRAMEA